MKDIVNYLEYTKLFLIISVGMIALTYLTHIIFTDKKIVKFIPGIVSIIIGIYGFITIDPRIILIDDIDNLTIIVMGMGMGIGLIGIFVALLINIYNKDKVKKTIKSEKTV